MRRSLMRPGSVRMRPGARGHLLRSARHPERLPERRGIKRQNPIRLLDLLANSFFFSFS